MGTVIQGKEKIRTSKGKLIEKYQCRMKGCNKMTERYIHFVGQITPICEKHKKKIEEWRKQNKKNKKS